MDYIGQFRYHSARQIVSMHFSFNSHHQFSSSLLHSKLFPACLKLVKSLFLHRTNSVNMSERKATILKSSAPKKISKIQFGTLNSEEIKLAAELQVSNREVFQMPLRNAAPFGCMDPRLGISDKISSCKTCQ